MIARREFITLLGGAAASGPLAARAEQVMKIPRIGVLSPGRSELPDPTRNMLNAFLEGLHELGYAEGPNDTWADTTTAHGRLMLTVLGGLAEFERELIRARTGDGRKRAKERGVKFGRPRKMTPHQRQEAIQRLAGGETMADVARTYAVDATTIGRLAASSPFEQSGAAL
jgi:hypothetical protein